tara:strand:- start:60 stop:458 length:399 start_codon:yes stop_codon:yes gene_type:complete
MKYVVAIVLLISSLGLQAQKYTELKSDESLTIRTKWQENKEGKKELRLKFKNKAKAHLTVNLEIGFYSGGILAEKALIADCLKKGFWNNWFRPVHLVIMEELDNAAISEDSFKIEVLELSTEQVKECSESDQ